MANSGSRTSFAGAIPPPMHGWPIGGVTSSVNGDTVSRGPAAGAAWTVAAAAAAARNSRRVTGDMTGPETERGYRILPHAASGRPLLA